MKASFRMRRREWQIQYEGLQDICFTCGKYGHKEIKCPLITTKVSVETEENRGEEASSEADTNTRREEQRSRFGTWMVAHRAQRRLAQVMWGNA